MPWGKAVPIATAILDRLCQNRSKPANDFAGVIGDNYIGLLPIGLVLLKLFRRFHFIGERLS